ncbi:MAG: M20/M25/M40 family metallo-hydrolase [Planctomycetota bacterium]|nr:M20/M25/M40 family metallo-hydrolase [Planctomycetota bacterium]MDA1177999.1 M20/M25/M40 family metallo-hydrolase [Planctomycetota bacterium]
MSTLTPASPAQIEQHLRYLTEQIGARLAGSNNERKAANYIADQGRHFGAVVSDEHFPVRERAVQSERVEVFAGGEWRAFPCSLFSNTPGTGGKAIEAPIVFFEAPAEHHRADFQHLTGRAVVHLGTHIESRVQYERLIAARPAFLMFVDIRYPGSVPLADGMFPEYTHAIGAVPTVNIAYLDAWNWRIEGVTAARLTVEGGMQDSESCNVLLDLPGETDETIFVGGHHDTQADSVGADDNATAVAALLELVRMLAPRTRRRSIRLISFGAEEQLSVGSAAYVRRHRNELEHNGCLMWNFDSIGSPLGWTELYANGTPEMTEWITRELAARDVWVAPRTQIFPYSDHFPFVAAGVPSVLLYRPNCIAGRFFHHRPDDDLSRVSCQFVASLVDASAALLDKLANLPELPFPKRISPELADRANEVWADLFGGWGSTRASSPRS